MVLDISVEQRGNHAVVTVAGELDISTRQQFDDFLTQVVAEHGPWLILDLSGVGFMDSRALGIIIQHWRDVTAAGGRFALVGVSYRSARVMWITGLADRLPIYDDIASALAPG